jgi:hypothetical protein
VPATSAGLPRLLFFMQLLTVLMKPTRQAGRPIKQSILLRCLCLTPHVYILGRLPFGGLTFGRMSWQ